MSEVLYWGLFFDEVQFESETYSKVRSKVLENEVKDKHVTCGFKKGFPLKHREGDQVKVHVIGYGSDGMNEGFLVEILDDEVNSHYKGADQKHITLSLDPCGRAVDTANLKFEDRFLVAYELTGVISSR